MMAMKLLRVGLIEDQDKQNANKKESFGLWGYSSH
jgi:hypothetical protein